MVRNILLIVAALAMCGLSACGNSSESTPTANATSSTPQIGATPDGAVREFLQAVKDGDHTTAEQLLTPLAREKTAEYDIAVAPPGSDTASFEVLDVEQVADGGAHVASQWTDIDQTGQPHTDTLVWMLRREPEGWRIAGMGARLFPEEPPLFLNFEDPEDMLRKQELAAQEIERRMMEAQRQAQQPDAAGETLRQ